MTLECDFFDPNTWAPDDHVHRVYLTDDLELFAIVDAVDYPACVTTIDRFGQVKPLRWSSLGSKWKRTTNPKHYARRSTYEQYGEETEPYESPITGKLVRNRQRTVRSVFLHHFIAKRAGIVIPEGWPPDTPWRLDHRNGNSLDDRRVNLRWVPLRFNTANKHGSLADADPLDWHRMMTIEGAMQ